MPVISPIPGGPPQGPHRHLEEETLPLVSEETAKVSRAAGREGSAASKMQTVPREKLKSDSSWLSRFAHWVSGLFQAVFRRKTEEKAKPELAQSPVQAAGDLRARLNALPIDRQRECLEKMLAVFQEKVPLGTRGLFREEGDSVKREALKKALLSQMERGEIHIEFQPGETDELAAAFKTFLGPYLNKVLTDKGYEALKREGRQDEILEGLSIQDRAFMDSLFDFYRNFAAQQMENKAMNQQGVAVVFAPSFVREKDADLAVLVIIKALMKQIPQESSQG